MGIGQLALARYSCSMNVLVWLHRDLRTHDHAALTAAAETGAVLPVFVADPGEWFGATHSARQWQFVAETLAHARGCFATAGAPLVVRTGDRGEVIAKMIARHRIDRVISLGEPGPRLRAAAGIPWQVVAETDTVIAPPALCPLTGVEPGSIPPARALRLMDDRCPNRQTGGDPAELLGRRPVRGRPMAVTAMERQASRLSPHLAWGSISAVEVAGLPGLRHGVTLRATAKAAASTPRQGPSLTDAWMRGETGLPFADACLRYLAATGWLPAALRGVVASTALHVLGAGEDAAGKALARLSTDYDPDLLWYGIITQRPCNPVVAGQRFDPQGTFIRRWLPELACVPDAHLHRPWRWCGASMVLGRRYPEPLADPATALRSLVTAAPTRPAPRRRTAPTGQLAFAL